MPAQELFDHILAAAGADDEAAFPVVMEHPSPPCLLTDPHAGLVRLKNAAAQQLGADQLDLFAEGLAAVVQDIDQSAFTDFEPKDVRHQPRQPFERDRMAGAQIDGKGAQVRSERRTRFEPLRRRCLEPPGAARTEATMQRHPRHIRLDLGNLDVIVALQRRLRHARHVGRTMLAVRGHHVALAARDAAAGVRPHAPDPWACSSSRQKPSVPGLAVCWNCPVSWAADRAWLQVRQRACEVLRFPPSAPRPGPATSRSTRPSRRS